MKPIAFITYAVRKGVREPLSVIVISGDTIAAAGDPDYQASDEADQLVQNMMALPVTERQAAFMDLIDSKRRGSPNEGAVEAVDYTGKNKTRVDAIMNGFLGRRSAKVLKKS
jgi:hypothetical protein